VGISISFARAFSLFGNDCRRSFFGDIAFRQGFLTGFEQCEQVILVFQDVGPQVANLSQSMGYGPDREIGRIDFTQLIPPEGRGN
jgi:hypothetical protein